MNNKFDYSSKTLLICLLVWLLPNIIWAQTNDEDPSVVATGSCGESVTYTIYSDMSMVISGTGEMKDYVDADLHIDDDYYQKIKNVSIEEGVTSIGEFAFYYCTSLTSVTIGNGVTHIGNAAFNECYSLASVTIPNSVTEIGNGAFNLCSDLSSVEIPSSLTVISSALFFGCTSLASITIPEGVTEIGDAAFEWCTSLTSVSIPASVQSIGEGVFGSCTNLSSITVDAANTVYDSRDNCNAIIETSTNTLIAGCMSTIIPASVTAIGGYAFYECTGLTSVTIGNEVIAIEDYAFANCKGLTSITVENETPISISQKAFLNVDKAACTLYVPAGSKSAYESAEGWKEFENIEETGEDYVLGDANNDGRVNVSDFTAIANCIMGTPPATFVEMAADVNVDGTINVADLTGVANIILHGSAEPNASNAKTRNIVASEYANIEANDVTIALDEEFTVAIYINGNFEYSGYQLDIALPEGLVVKDVSGQTTSSDLFLSDMINDNTLRVLYASTTGEVAESSVVYLTLVADDEGIYNIDIDNAIVSVNASQYVMSKSSFLASVGNNTTGISLSNEQAANNVVYDLAGKMWNDDMSRLPKGVYIINGKKVIK